MSASLTDRLLAAAGSPATSDDFDPHAPRWTSSPPGSGWPRMMPAAQPSSSAPTPSCRARSDWAARQVSPSSRSPSRWARSGDSAAATPGHHDGSSRRDACARWWTEDGSCSTDTLPGFRRCTERASGSTSSAPATIAGSSRPTCIRGSIARCRVSWTHGTTLAPWRRPSHAGTARLSRTLPRKRAS